MLCIATMVLLQRTTCRAMKQVLTIWKRIAAVFVGGCASRPYAHNGARAMSTDNDWWSWILIGAFFLLTTPATYVPVAKALGIF